MDIAILSDLLSAAMPAGLIVVGVWFFLAEAWPYWKARDTENRKLKHELEQKQLETEGLMASAISLVANHLEQPIRVIVIGDDGVKAGGP
jgi:hypothetical protein